MKVVKALTHSSRIHNLNWHFPPKKAISIFDERWFGGKHWQIIRLQRNFLPSRRKLRETCLTEINQNRFSWTASQPPLGSMRNGKSQIVQLPSQNCLVGFYTVPLHSTFIYLPLRRRTFITQMNFFLCRAPFCSVEIDVFAEPRELFYGSLRTREGFQRIFNDAKHPVCEAEARASEREEFNLWSVYHRLKLTPWIGFGLARYASKASSIKLNRRCARLVGVLMVSVSSSSTRETRHVTHSARPRRRCWINIKWIKGLKNAHACHPWNGIRSTLHLHLFSGISKMETMEMMSSGERDVVASL